MSTWQTVCDRAAQLPGAELGTQHGAPAWRVRGKVFVQLNPGLRVPDEDELRREGGDLVMILVDPDERRALVEAEPATFLVTPHYASTRWVLAWLRTAEPVQLGELVEDAWRIRASAARRRQRDSP